MKHIKAWVATITIIVYISFAWKVYQYRNPHENEMAFYRNFIDVVTFSKTNKSK
jgi:predicted negative regulator of RcsB-dependent stress response